MCKHRFDMLFIVSDCPKNCKTCSTSNTASFTQTTSGTTDIRTCSVCDTSRYWHTTKKECLGRFILTEKKL